MVRFYALDKISEDSDRSVALFRGIGGEPCVIYKRKGHELEAAYPSQLHSVDIRYGASSSEKEVSVVLDELFPVSYEFTLPPEEFGDVSCPGITTGVSNGDTLIRIHMNDGAVSRPLGECVFRLDPTRDTLHVENADKAIIRLPIRYWSSLLLEYDASEEINAVFGDCECITFSRPSTVERRYTVVRKPGNLPRLNAVHRRINACTFDDGLVLAHGGEVFLFVIHNLADEKAGYNLPIYVISPIEEVTIVVCVDEAYRFYDARTDDAPNAFIITLPPEQVRVMMESLRKLCDITETI